MLYLNNRTRIFRASEIDWRNGKLVEEYENAFDRAWNGLDEQHRAVAMLYAYKPTIEDLSQQIKRWIAGAHGSVPSGQARCLKVAGKLANRSPIGSSQRRRERREQSRAPHSRHQDRVFRLHSLSCSFRFPGTVEGTKHRLPARRASAASSASRAPEEGDRSC